LTRYRWFIVNAIFLVALLGSQVGRRIENATVTHPDFLKELNLPFRGWVTSDTAITQDELDLLQPDATLVRRYKAPDNPVTSGPKAGKEAAAAKDVKGIPEAPWAELAVIAGHRKRSVHTPAFCMTGGGWEILSKKNFDIALSDGRRIPATRAVMIKDNAQLVTTYFFTDGDYCTRDLLRFQGAQIMKRFQAKVPLGALVRVIVPVSRSQADSENLSDVFSQAVVPGVLESLRHAELKM
jgi:hypothetical protein